MELNDWGSGFVANYTVTNNGASWNGWTMTFTLGSGQHTNGWNGSWSQQGSTVTVSNAPWNGSVGTGQSVTFGHQGTQSGNVSFTNFSVNGAACAAG